MDRIELLRDAYRHISETGAWPWDMYAPDARFDPSAVGLPVTCDQAEAAELWREYIQSFDAFRIDPVVFIDAGPDRIVVVVRDGGRPAGSSQEIHNEYTHVWTFGADDKVTGWASFSTRAEALAHAGVEETP